MTKMTEVEGIKEYIDFASKLHKLNNVELRTEILKLIDKPEAETDKKVLYKIMSLCTRYSLPVPERMINAKSISEERYKLCYALSQQFQNI